MYGDSTVPPHASHYTPKFRAGARLPHAWITLESTALAPVDVSYVDEFSAEDAARRRYSTLDLCACDRFTLIGDLEVRGVNTVRLGKDFELVDEDGKQWAENAGLRSGGGLLVRPDQHILMVLGKETNVGDIEMALSAHLRTSE